MWFIKKRKEPSLKSSQLKETKTRVLPSHDPKDFENWIPYVIESLHLPEGKYSFAPVFDGILLYIYNEGLMWIPKTELVKLPFIKQFTKSILSATPYATGFYTGGPIASFLTGMSTRILKKQLYRYTFSPPPSKVTGYLQSSIKRIEIIPFDYYAGYLKKFKKTSFRKHEPSLNIPQEEGAIRIVDVFSEIPKLSEKENNSELELDHQETSVPHNLILYRYPSYHEIKPFLEAIKDIGIPIYLGK